MLPLHRIDAGAELIGDPEAYLSVMRYQAALVGDKRPCESVDQLRLRDGLASVDPADYASQQPLGPRTIRSVLDAMNRR